MPALKTIALTAIAMIAFAANSLLCRLALQKGSVDPASFASIRLVSGAIVLVAIVRLRSVPSTTLQRVSTRADWLAVTMLFVYVAFFSFAYVSLPAGTGALILFGAVQLTMLGAGLRSGERFALVAWVGLLLAGAGLVVLVLPGVAAAGVQQAISAQIQALPTVTAKNQRQFAAEQRRPTGLRAAHGPGHRAAGRLRDGLRGQREQRRRVLRRRDRRAPPGLAGAGK